MLMGLIPGVKLAWLRSTNGANFLVKFAETSETFQRESMKIKKKSEKAKSEGETPKM